jgi:ubiquinone/menaquinone biosynthesis C-methylase UbiE
VIVIDWSVDALEHLRKTSAAPDVSYLIGEAEVLPLPDASVDAVRTSVPPGAAAAAEYFRVIRQGGYVALGGPTASALNLGERVLGRAGFVEVTVVQEDGSPLLAARKP